MRLGFKTKELKSFNLVPKRLNQQLLVQQWLPHITVDVKWSSKRATVSTISQLLPGHCCQLLLLLPTDRTCTASSSSASGSTSHPKIRPTCVFLAQQKLVQSPLTPLICGWPSKMQRSFLESHQPPTTSTPQGHLGACILPLSPLPSPQHCCSALSWMQLLLIHGDSSLQGSHYNPPWSQAHITLYLWKCRLAGSSRRLPRLGGSRGSLPALPEGQVPGTFFIPCIFPTHTIWLRLHKKLPSMGALPRCRRGFPRALVRGDSVPLLQRSQMEGWWVMVWVAIIYKHCTGFYFHNPCGSASPRRPPVTAIESSSLKFVILW